MNAPHFIAADPALMPLDDRFAELAHLLARAYLRARARTTARRVRHVAPIVATVARTAAQSPVVVAESALALCSEGEPPCPQRERRGVPGRSSLNRDMTEDEL